MLAPGTFYEVEAHGMQREDRIFIGYLQAMLAASALFVVINYVVVLFSEQSNAPIGERAIHHLSITAIAWPVVAVIAFFLAAIPFWLAKKIAHRRSLHSTPYYIICGGIAGACTAILALTLITAPSTAPEPAFWTQFARMAVQSVPSGALGGYVYWRRVRNLTVHTGITPPPTRHR